MAKTIKNLREALDKVDAKNLRAAVKVKGKIYAAEHPGDDHYSHYGIIMKYVPASIRKELKSETVKSIWGYLDIVTKKFYDLDEPGAPGASEDLPYRKQFLRDRGKSWMRSSEYRDHWSMKDDIDD